MTTMLAAKLHRIGEPMRLEQVPVPTPRPTDVLVAVKACGVVPNLINVLTYWQTWFPELPLPKLPAIFGLDVASPQSAIRCKTSAKATGSMSRPACFAAPVRPVAPTTP